MVTLDEVRKRIALRLQESMNVPYSMDTAISRTVQELWMEGYDEGYKQAWREAKVEIETKIKETE